MNADVFLDKADAVADGYFATGTEPEAMDAVEIVAKALTNVLNCGMEAEKATTNPPKIGGLATVSIPESDRARPLSLPLGVQIIGVPYSEAVILRVAAVLEAQGVVSAKSIDH